MCCAVSKDGIHWEKPELGIVDFDGNKRNKIVMRAPLGMGVTYDLHEPNPLKRYKILLPRREVAKVWFSGDGLDWKMHELSGLDYGDTLNNSFWAPALGKYGAFTRHWGEMGREVSQTESPDFLHWTPAEVVFKGLTPQLQIHDMGWSFPMMASTWAWLACSTRLLTASTSSWHGVPIQSRGTVSVPALH